MDRITRSLVLGAYLAVAAYGCAQHPATHEESTSGTAIHAGKANRGQAIVTKEEAGFPTIVAPLFTAGLEVVIQPQPTKVKASGITPEQWQQLRAHRFTREDWRAEIGGNNIDLTTIAWLTVRPIHTPPFTVVLPDGRKAVVTPNPKRIGEYLVTGQDFERSVRAALAEPFVMNPAKVCVLSGIRVPGGHVPNKWGPDHVHISLGESLERFASVQIQCQPNPRAVDLVLWRSTREMLETMVREEKQKSRQQFEKTFGAGKQEGDPGVHGWDYPIGSGSLQVFYDDAHRITSINPITGPWPQSSQPADHGREARAAWKRDRAFLFAFLKTKFQRLAPSEKARLRAFLDRTAPVLKWTQSERKQLLHVGRK
jgi:hypothetical protein